MLELFPWKVLNYNLILKYQINIFIRKSGLASYAAVLTYKFSFNYLYATSMKVANRRFFIHFHFLDRVQHFKKSSGTGTAAA